MQYEHKFSKFTLKYLSTDDGNLEAEEFLGKGTEAIIALKVSKFRKHLHDCFQEVIRERADFAYSGDIDMTLLFGVSSNHTPDLCDLQSNMVGDVAIVRFPGEVAREKLYKYKEWITEKISLVVFTFDTDTELVESFTFVRHEDQTIKEVRQEYDVLNFEEMQGISRSLQLYKSMAKFESASVSVFKGHPDLPITDLCDEAKQFSNADDGLLNKLLNEASFDSPPELFQHFRKKTQKRLDVMARQIAGRAKSKKSTFNQSTYDGITAAYDEAETFVKANYEIIREPKPSCHGIPGLLEKIKKLPDTRQAIVEKFLDRMSQSKRDIFLELKAAITYNIEVLVPERMKKRQLMAQELASIKNKTTKQYKELDEAYKVEMRKTYWDRNSLRAPEGGKILKLMRIGKKSKFEPKVVTVPFFEDGFSLAFENEIRTKVRTFVDPEHCLTPHKEYKPKLKERGPLYEKFLQTKFYQELYHISQLAGNILRLVTKSRGFCSVTTASNANMMAIVGPGDSANNEASTVPILWLAINEEDSKLWMPSYCRELDLVISNGDRLTKARLEQMVDAPRIASIAASIICCELKGEEHDILYACGVMSAVAMSINIRDSELIDHIRYMVPNIFSERSCAEEYIKEKYANPLKTGLQALLYKEAKKTILASSKIAKQYYEVLIENDEIVSGGVKMVIPFLDCTANSVYQLNGIVYTAFFSCKKGLHEPRSENRKMFDKICEFEYKSKGKSLVEASFDKSSYHYFDPEYIALTMFDMVDYYGNVDTWRYKFNRMDNLKKPYELNTFSSLRSSMQSVRLLDEIKSIGAKSKLKSSATIEQIERVSNSWDHIWSDDRTRVIDHFYDNNNTILDEGRILLTETPKMGFYATWDQKRQRTGRDREVFILDPNGKVLMHNVESLFKSVCEGVPHELITLPGNKKIVAMNMKGTQFFKKLKKLKNQMGPNGYQQLRMTADMTKWAPGDNVCKFIYAIAGLPFLKRHEKVWYINFLCSSIRKTVVLNTLTTEVIGNLASKGLIRSDEMWAQMLGVEVEDNGVVRKLKNNMLDIRFNWLMGVLNDTSSAVHAASATMLRRVLEVDYEIQHYEPDVHSDDAAADLIVTKKVGKKEMIPIFDYFPLVLVENLKGACIKLSEKKTYFDKYRKEFVSEVDDNGIMKSYWQKQAIAAISGLSYIDFFRDLSEGASKVSNLIALGGPPTVFEVTMSNVIDMARETYSMQPGMWNDTDKFLDIPKHELPLELGGSIDMNLTLLPVAGVKYHTFSKMMKFVLATAGVSRIEDINEGHRELMESVQGDLFCKVWMETTEVAVKEGLVLSRLDPGIIRFRQFSSFEKTKELRLMKELKDYNEDKLQLLLEKDPTLSFRQPENINEHKAKLAMLIKTPSWYSSATLQSQGALKLDRMFNVKTPCCSPMREDGKVIEKGMKTIREAIRDAVEMLKKRNLTTWDTYQMLKSMPLMCYLYDIEKKVDFKRTNEKQLFPVQKESFMKGSMISSSVVGLLQRMYTGDTKYYLDYFNLDEDLETIERYQNNLSEMERPQQAVALYRIFQQTTHFSSVFFVPSARYKGHEAILGLMSNGKSDIYNYMPKEKFLAPENIYYLGLQKKHDLKVEQKCSQFACFLYRVCTAESMAQTILKKTRIEGKTVEDIMKKCSYRNKDSAYAKALLGDVDNMYVPGPGEMVWLAPQEKSYPNWKGEFCVYMNVGTRMKPTGILLFGVDEFLTKISFFEPHENYPNLKSKLITFNLKMRWFHGLMNHIKFYQSDDPEELVLTFNPYGSDIQTRIRSGEKGIQILFLPRGISHPVHKFHSLTRSGIMTTLKWRTEESEVQLIHQRITEHFEVQCDDKIGGVSIQQLWDEQWATIARNYRISVDTFAYLTTYKGIYLPNDTVYNLKNVLRYYRTILDEPFSGGPITNLPLNVNIFSPGTKWSSFKYSLYLSMAMDYESKLTSWISLKGYLLGLHNRFQYYNYEEREEFSFDPEYSFSYKTDYVPSMIYKYKTVDFVKPTIDEIEKDNPLDPNRAWKVSSQEIYRQYPDEIEDDDPTQEDTFEYEFRPVDLTDPSLSFLF